ncbi:hypothetical protein [Flammeovirga aprica]|uniref:Uncharacterized protein n=1 Tax=Flammeovirga aprica JL-4 TaxID=694437 RepID=A0A7X9RWK6_9BACT|nr:hypothetical protein [Flammeovirga aprica]NME70025.1 hypothetical protein [Flammeovirga aprica JL-4]
MPLTSSDRFIGKAINDKHFIPYKGYDNDISSDGVIVFYLDGFVNHKTKNSAMVGHQDLEIIIQGFYQGYK